MFKEMISECCGQLIVMTDVCSECREHCDEAESVEDRYDMFVDRLRDINPDAMLIDGMDRAIIGIEEVRARAVYSVEKIIKELMRINDWHEETAREWYEFNISTAHVGEYTPILVYNMMDETEQVSLFERDMKQYEKEGLLQIVELPNDEE